MAAAFRFPQGLKLSVPSQGGTPRRNVESSSAGNCIIFCYELTLSRPKAGGNALACRFMRKQ